MSESLLCIKNEESGKFIVQLEYIFPRLIIVNNGKGIRYFLVYNGMYWN